MSDSKTPTVRPRRLRTLISALAVAAASAAAGLWCTDTYTRARWRELTLPELEAQSRQHPSERYLLALLAQRQIEAHLHAPAAATLQDAISAGLNDETAWRTLAAAAAAGGDTRSAVGALQVGARDPALAAAFHKTLAALQALPPGSDNVQVAQTIAPDGLGGLAGLNPPNAFSRLLERWGQRNPERSGFATRERWARERPDDPAVQILWARALTENRRYPDAEAVLIPILQKNPAHFDAALALADTRYAAGVPARAGIVYRACLKDRPDSFPAALGVARCAVDVKLVYLGVEASQTATRLNPNSAEAWACLGRAYFNQKLRWDKAVEAFAKAQQLDPSRTDYFAPYYDALRSTNRLEEGEKLLRRRIEQAPNDAQAHYLLATALLDYRADAGATAEAEKALRRSLELQPDVPATRAKLAQILLDHGQAAEAVPLLEEAVKLDGYYALSRRLLARAYRMNHQIPEAEATEKSARALDAYIQRKTPLEDAQSSNPTDPKIHRQLARIYREGQEIEKAVNAEQMAYMLEHRKADAERGLRNLMNETNLSASTEWASDGKKKPAPSPSPKP